MADEIARDPKVVKVLIGTVTSKWVQKGPVVGGVGRGEVKVVVAMISNSSCFVSDSFRPFFASNESLQFYKYSLLPTFKSV